MERTHSPAKKGRRFHHKSRYGCTPCKHRRIKCDERKPVCNNCVERSVDCSFNLKSTLPTADRQSSTRTLTRVPRPLSQAPGLSFCRGDSRDLELFCHFQIYTAPAFNHPASVEKLFRDEFPRIAASFPFLGHGLLSIAYIHLAHLSKNQNTSKLLAESALHINQALPGYLGAIKDITKDNSDALFGFALLVVLFTFADVGEECDGFLRMARDEASTKARAIQGLANAAARVARSLQTIFGIFWRCQHWISSGPLSPVIQRYDSPPPTDLSVHWINCEDKHLAKLSNLWASDLTVPFQRSFALFECLRCLRETFAMVTQLTFLRPSDSDHGRPVPLSHDLADIHRRLCAGRLYDLPSVFTWYIRLSPEFIRMLEEGNVYAMVVLAHFAIVLDRACADKWWTHQLPHHLVAMAELILGQERRGWIEWPLMVVARHTPR
ncbi:hypothetical protein BJX99DRAFT_264912 [Aspergillus californicus]